MQFNKEAFNRHLLNMGQNILWQSSFACSCVNPSSGSADPKCTLCSKKGRIWENRLPTVCGICQQKTQNQWADLGLWEQGDLVVSIPEDSPMWDSGQFDRVTMLNATDKFSLPLVRGGNPERLLFVPERIDRVFWKANDQSLVEGGIPTIDDNGVPSWAGGIGEPPSGKTYSITGWKYCEYFVFGDFPSNRNMHQGMRLPKRVVLRRWDLFGR